MIGKATLNFIPLLDNIAAQLTLILYDLKYEYFCYYSLAYKTTYI